MQSTRHFFNEIMDILQQWKYFSTHCVVWSVYSFLRLLCTSFCPTKICYGFYVACLVIPKISPTLYRGLGKYNMNREKKSFFFLVLFSLCRNISLGCRIWDGFIGLMFLLWFFASNARSHIYWSVYSNNLNKRILLCVLGTGYTTTMLIGLHFPRFQ